MENDIISRQAAIEAIRAFYDEYIVYDNGKSIEDLILELPSAQPVDKDINVLCKDTISRQDAIDAVSNWLYDGDDRRTVDQLLSALPPAQPETCEGCKHLGKWEDELYYGVYCPCINCKRRVNDNYE